MDAGVSRGLTHTHILCTHTRTPSRWYSTTVAPPCGLLTSNFKHHTTVVASPSCQPHRKWLDATQTSQYFPYAQLLHDLHCALEPFTHSSNISVNRPFYFIQIGTQKGGQDIFRMWWELTRLSTCLCLLMLIHCSPRAGKKNDLLQVSFLLHTEGFSCLAKFGRLCLCSCAYG